MLELSPWPWATVKRKFEPHHAIFDKPLSPADAADNLDQLLALPHVQTVGEQDRCRRFSNIEARDPFD